METRQKNILSLLWAIPLLTIFFFIATILRGPKTPHVFLILKTIAMCLSFSTVSSFLYRQTKVIGISIFLALATMVIAGIIPIAGPLLYWAIVGYLLKNEINFLRYDFTKEEKCKVKFSAIALALVQLPYFTLQFSQLNNEARLVNSQLHIDTLYHTAIAAMLKMNHVVSHGLHGLGPLEYHFGSHVFMAALSNIGFSSAFQSYNYFFVFLCIPLLGVAIISMAEELLPSQNDSDFYKKLLTYVFLFLCTGILLVGSFLYRFALWRSFFESESYTLSLILLMCLFSISLNSKLDMIKRFLLVSAVVGFMSLTKVSTGFCGLSLIGSWALLTSEKWWTKKWWMQWSILLFCGLLFLVLFRLINPGMSDAIIEPFQFVRTYVDFHGPFWLTLTLFIILHFIFPVSSLLYYGFYRINKAITPFIPQWWALGIFLSFAIGLGSVLILYVTGGSGFYFSNVSMFMALPVLLCIPQAGKKLFLKHSKIYTIFFVLLSFVYGPRLLVSGVKNFLGKVRQPIPATELQVYVEKLHKIRDDASSLNALVYIPRTETAYWKSLDCRGTGYLIPAVSERPALYAWPSKDCYAFLCGPRFHSDGLCEKSQESYTDSELMNEAKRLGYSKVEIVTSKGIRSLRE